MDNFFNKLFTLLIITILLHGENEVCFEVESNPNPLDPALTNFSKYVNVLDCFDIYAESSISDAKVLHAASVVAELLDNNEDGIVDDPILEIELKNAETMMPIFSSEWSPAMDDVWDYYDGCVSAALFNNEIDPTQPGHWGDDASVEEILHTINHCGHVEIYPSTFSLWPNSSLLSDAMDIARGGQFINIPSQYPEEAWYHYDDWTCDYECMAIEYLYWCIVSYMGILDDFQTCSGIDNEWELCTPELFESIDVSMFTIITDEQYKIPQLAPDGNYCPSNNIEGDLNADGIVNILDAVVMINLVLSGNYDGMADLNLDGVNNILDIIALINIIIAD